MITTHLYIQQPVCKCRSLVETEKNPLKDTIAYTLKGSTIHPLRVSHSFSNCPTFANVPDLIVPPVCPQNIRSTQTMFRSATEGIINVGDIVTLQNNTWLVLCIIEVLDKSLMLFLEIILPYQEEPRNTNSLCTDRHIRSLWAPACGCDILPPLRPMRRPNQVKCEHCILSRHLCERVSAFPS